MSVGGWWFLSDGASLSRRPGGSFLFRGHKARCAVWDSRTATTRWRVMLDYVQSKGSKQTEKRKQTRFSRVTLDYA